MFRAIAAPPAAAEAAPPQQQELRHHRHWQKVLQLVSGMQLSTLPTPLPANGNLLTYMKLYNLMSVNRLACWSSGQ